MSHPEIKPVFNYDFSTVLVFKCTRKKFADSFLSGNIYFNKPKAWVRDEELGNKGRGDILEGTFLAAKSDDTSHFIENLKSSPGISNFEHNSVTYFRRSCNQELFCLCMYGLNSNSFNSWTDANGDKHLLSKISKDYFTDFSENLSRDDFSTIDDSEKPVVIMIKNPHEFFIRLRKALSSLGVPGDDIIIAPVEYIDKSQPHIANIPSPLELLLKDSYYDHQSEIRVIINTTNMDFLQKMEDSSSTVSIGSLYDIAEVFDFYFDDMVFDMVNGNQIMFNLPHPEERSFNDMRIDELVDLYIKIEREAIISSSQILSGKAKEDALAKIKKMIETRFGVVLSHRGNQIIICTSQSSTES